MSVRDGLIDVKGGIHGRGALAKLGNCDWSLFKPRIAQVVGLLGYTD